MYEFTTLDIAGYRGEPLANTFMRQDGPARHLALLLPGIAYTTDMPLLYYARSVVLARGADALSLETDYHRQRGFRSAAPAEQYRWLTADAAAGCAVALAQRPYERITLVGKSLGTLAMGHLVAHEERVARARPGCVWLTPLLADERLRQQVRDARPRSLFVSGGADGQYDERKQRELVEAVGGQSLVVDGADHSLEIEGDLAASLRALGQVMEAIRAFVDAGQASR